VTAAALQKRPKRNTLRDAIYQMEQRLGNRLDSQDKILLEVVNNMSYMNQRFEKRFNDLEKKIDHVEVKLTIRMDDLEEKMIRRMDALEEDLTATMVDTIKIRTFVGMPLPEED
jgi:hypothetical protein